MGNVYQELCKFPDYCHPYFLLRLLEKHKSAIAFFDLLLLFLWHIFSGKSGNSKQKDILQTDEHLFVTIKGHFSGLFFI